ncbi:MAG TPA: serine/threonine-protein kinase [Polyangiaceae bacterium]|jgi:serine/threonine-protein kinase|nr:serine/threonine-protein kinase [Polyangiaceae bacterium]
MSQDPNQKAGAGRAGSLPGKPSVPRPSVEPITGLKLVTVRPPADSIDQSAPSSELGPPVSRVDSLIGFTIDNRYKVEAILGEGGMGIVYRCRHKIIDKKVAMKVLRADLARDHELTERFLLEAKSASQIGHEHIIDISDFGQLPDGATYFVMEYLDGTPLTGIVDNDHPVPVPRLLHIARQLAEGLAAAHEAGIVHRDLKPDNIFLVNRGNEKDFVKILDFGIAKVSTSASGALTRAGSVFGTPHYMSPEQAAGAPVDHRGDIYSFGVILYELSCGKVPFDADNFMGILTQHMYKAPVPIRALVPAPQDVPPGLEAVILKCLSKRPEQRYGSMRELMDEIDKLRSGLVPAAVSEMMARSGGFNVPADFFKMQGRMPAPMPASPMFAPKSRWPLFAGAAGVAVALALVVAIFTHASPSPASPPVALPPAPLPIAPVAVAAPAATANPPATTPVAMDVEPDDAEVFRDGTSLGTSPVIVEVPNGKSVDVEVRRDGYATQRITLDGTQQKLKVRLEKVPGATPVAHPHVAGHAPAHPAVATHAATPDTPSRPASKPAIGGSEIVNPWGH